MAKNDFESRKEKILELVIEDYINTASPISSRLISHRLRKSLSPATIRNVMADLEDAGFITHPHTSAGRIPTDRGYRYYINSLMRAKFLTEDEKRKIDEVFRQRYEEIDDIIIKTSRLLSIIAQEIGLVTFPTLEKTVLKHIELFEIDNDKILAVLITKNGLVKNIVIECERPLKKNELEKIAAILNSRFNGVSLQEIKRAIAKQLLLQRDSFFYALDEAKRIIELILNAIKDERVYLDGAYKIVTQPEFRSLKKIEALLKALDNPQTLNYIVKKNFENENVGVYIGDEIDVDELCDCSFVGCNYTAGRDNIGVLGIIGPKRMPYARIVSLVDYAAKCLSEILE